MAATAPRMAFDRKSGVRDFPDAYSKKMLDLRDKLQSQAEEELRACRDFQDIQRTIDLLEGKWWSEARPQYRSRYYDSYLSDQRREALASLSDIRPAMDITCKVEAYKKQGNICLQYIRHLWDEQDMDLKVVSWVDHALFGTGFWKLTAYEPGEFEVSAHGLDSVMPVQLSGADLQTASAVIYRAYQSIPYFISKFGEEKCVGLEREAVNLSGSLQGERYMRPNSVPEYTWNAMSPAMKRRMSLRGGPTRQASSDFTQFPLIELREIYLDDWSFNENDHDVLVKHPDLDVDEHNFHYIVPSGRRLFPRKRLIIFAGDRIMYDGPSPFWHGEYPFVMLQLNPCVWAPGGISKYRDLIPLCNAINRIGGGVEETVLRALNNNVVSKRGVVPEPVWDKFQPSKPGQKILLNPTSMNPKTDFAWMDPPSLPAYVGEFLRYLVDTIKRRSGSLDISGLARKKQAPGGETIENMRDAMSSPFRLEGRYVEAALKRAGRQTVSNIFQFATHDQRLKVLGVDGQTWEDFDYKASSMLPMSSPKEDHWQKFPIRISQGSMHGNSRMQKVVQAYTLFRSGALSMAGLYRQTEFPENFEQVAKELAEEHKSGLGVPAGRTPRSTRSSKTGGPL